MALRTPSSPKGHYDEQGNKDSAPPRSSDSTDHDGSKDAPNLAQQEADGEGFKYTSGGTLPNLNDDSPASMVEGSLYGSNNSEPRSTKLGGALKSKRARLMGGGAGILGAGLIAFSIFILPALRLESYMQNINQRVFGFASDAVSHRVENLFGRYMISHVLTLERCGGKITATCRADYTNSGVASGLFNNWRDAKIEEKLFDKYGLEVTSLKNPSSADGAHRFVLKDRWGRQVTLTNGDLRSGRFTGGSRELGNEINKFLRENTKWYDVMQRRSVRKYLVRKHGTKFWCFFACKQQDAVDNKVLDAKTRLKYKLIERTVYPLSSKYGLIIDCITSGDATKCSPDNLAKKGLDRSKLSQQDIDDLKKFEKNPDLKLSQFLVEKILIKMGVEQITAKSVVSGIPVAGQVYLGLTVVDGMENIKQFIDNNGLSKMAADINASQYIEYYTAMRTASDEVKAGKTSADEVGALVSQYDGAEQSKVYQAYYSPNSGSKTPPSSFASLFSPSAYAATAQNDGYTCANGKPIPTDELVCPEKTVDKRTFKIEAIFDDSTVKSLVSSLDLYAACYPAPAIAGHCIGVRPKDVVHPVLQGTNWLINNTVGALISKAFGVVKVLPGIGDFLSLIEKEAGRFFNSIFSQIFPLPVQTDSPSRDKYDGLEAGGEQLASEFGKGGYTDAGQPFGLGGKLLTPKQQSAILQDYQQQQDYNYKNSSLIARVTDLNYNHSLANQFIAVMPTSLSQVTHFMTGLIMHPFGGLHFGGSATAQTNLLTKSPFGIPRYGFPVDDPSLGMDPANLTPEYCQSAKKNHDDSKTTNPITGVDEYSVTDPCLLEQVAVEAAGSLFTGNDSLDDGIQSNTTTSTATGSVDMNHLYDDSTGVACASGTKDLGTQDGYHDGSLVKIKICAIPNIQSGGEESRGGFGVSGADGNLVVNSRVSGTVFAMAEAAKKGGVILSANSGFRTMAHQQSLCPCDGVTKAHPGFSNHQMGLAIDFAGGLPSTPGPISGNAFWNWLSTNAANFNYKNYPREAWHWSPSGN